ncbi:MAG: M15 family metallopeptidase [Candidatus Dojkabacteria bacterium]
MEIIRNIFGAIGALILSINTHTIVYNENINEEDSQKQRIVQEFNIVTEIPSEKLVPKKSTSNSSVASGSWWSYPTDIKSCARNGNDLLILVNKEYKLPQNYAPSDLVSASLSGIRKGSGYTLRNILINDLKALVNRAKSDGIDLSIRSAYRSYSTQIATYNYWLNVNGGSISATDKVSARAGHSQHQLGTAIDFSSSEIADGLGGSFSSTKASKWLATNAWKYGFVISYPSGYESTTGYSYESWHYRYIGKTNAQEMINSGMILELYLRSKN